MFDRMIIRACAVAAAGLVLLSGTAHAYPVKGAAELTHNELYKKGKLPKVTCKAVKGTTKASTTKYVNDLIGCMSTAWKSSIPDFEPVKVSFLESSEKRSCNGTEISGSFVEQCFSFMRVRLTADWIKSKDDSKVFAAVTDAWSGIVHDKTGIGLAWQALPNGGEQAEIDEQLHRLRLQSDCLSGVTYKSLGRVVKNWKPVYKAMKPPEYAKYKWEGKLANRLSWSKKGYQAGGPSVCNTWKAPSSKVA
jgi:predicted metalloprotease